MTILLALLASAAAKSPSATPWPTDAPLVYRFLYSTGWVHAVYGGMQSDATSGLAFTWTCTAKPPRKNGRQEMLCAEPGLGDVWILWGPGREVLRLDIDEDASELGSDRHVHRANIFAGALELWPRAPMVGTKWTQGGRFGVLQTAPDTTAFAFVLEHTVVAAEGTRLTITSAGDGTMLYGASSADTEARLEIGTSGESLFDTRSGLVVWRGVQVYPTRVVSGSSGTMRHGLVVRLVSPSPPGPADQSAAPAPTGGPPAVP